MASPLSGQRALVTGASRGIGRAVAVELAASGASVWALARSADQLRSLAAETPRTEPIVCDLTDRDATLRAAEHCAAASILVNNAGWATPRTAVQHTRLEDWQRTLDTCLLAPMLLTRALLPHMLERGAGTIVQILSPSAKQGRPGEAAYSAAKSGLRGFSESLREELADTPLRVITVYPGYVDTDFIPPNKKVDRSAFLQPEDIAHAVIGSLLDVDRRDTLRL